MFCNCPESPLYLFSALISGLGLGLFPPPKKNGVSPGDSAFLNCFVPA